MKKTGLIVILVLSVLSLRAQQPSTALEMNEYIVEISDELYEKGMAWGEAFSLATDSRNFSALTPHRKEMEDFANQSISDLENLRDIGGSYELRMAMISFLKYEKDLITNAFIPFESLNSESSQEEIDAALAKLTTLSEQETGELEKVNAAQERYARANGFMLEE